MGLFFNILFKLVCLNIANKFRSISMFILYEVQIVPFVPVIFVNFHALVHQDGPESSFAFLPTPDLVSSIIPKAQSVSWGCSLLLGHSLSLDLFSEQN